MNALSVPAYQLRLIISEFIPWHPGSPPEPKIETIVESAS